VAIKNYFFSIERMVCHVIFHSVPKNGFNRVFRNADARFSACRGIVPEPSRTARLPCGAGFENATPGMSLGLPASGKSFRNGKYG
jgi:hypothetical protein